MMEVGQDVGQFTFGLDKDKMIAELRRFADAIEKEIILPQSIMEVVTNKQDEFTTRRLVLTYVEKRSR